jgi:hypothetical protein
VQAALEHVQFTSINQNQWKGVIQALGRKVCSPCTLISTDNQAKLSQLVSYIEGSIPGHKRGTQNCVSTVLDVFCRDVQHVSKHFLLQIENNIFCDLCKSLDKRKEMHTVLPLCIKPGMSMQDGISDFMRTNQIKERFCPCCGATESKHRLEVLAAGKVLLINVKKEAVHQIRDPLASIKIGSISQNCYELKGVIGYSGDGKIGHYWNYIIDEQSNEVVSDAHSRRGTDRDTLSIAKCGVMFLYEQIGSPESNSGCDWPQVQCTHCGLRFVPLHFMG